jgi:C4-dicarboxylate-specific signal transduction histidine kinase
LEISPIAEPSKDLFMERVHEEDRPGVLQVLETASSSVRECAVEFRVVLPSGDVRNFQFRSMRDGNNEDTFCIAVIKDVTADIEVAERLRRLESDLANVSRTAIMGEVAASIAHEVNQPLAAIIATGGAGIRWLDRAVPNIANTRANLIAITEQAKKANDVIARVRSLFRNDEQPAELVDLPAMLHEVVPVVGHMFKAHNVKLSIEAPNDLPFIFGDKIQVQQVLLNLIVNAVQAMSNSTVRSLHAAFSYAADDNLVVIEISDTGPGVGQELPKIFDAFFTTKAAGLGLGLSISKTIVERHGGTITVNNRGGGGAIFRISLPASVGA